MRSENTPPSEAAQQSQADAFDKTKFSLTDPASPWLVVNKKRILSPATYAPTDLTTPATQLKSAGTSTDMQVRAETARALESMIAAAKNENINLMLASGYRSYNTQNTIYNSEVRAYGQATADKESARPGHSEHQTGWAADVGATNRKCELQACFADSAEGKWLAANAHSFGFIIRYPKDKTAVTGYTYEPWHVRYVGTDLSNQMYKENIETLEEFFNLPAAPDY